MKTWQILIMALAVIVSSCSKKKNEPELPAEEKVSRTVLVYMVATNSLGDGSLNRTHFDELDIKEMEKAVKAGALNGGRLLLYHAASGDVPRLKEVTEEGVIELKEYNEEDSPVAVATMRSVLDDMRRYAANGEYGLVMWSHSSGWMDNDKSPEIPVLKSWGIHTFPSETGEKVTQEMSIPSLGDALNSQNLLFVYFDCCFMGNIESIYEIKHSSKYVIASPTEVPGGGMDYQQSVPVMFNTKFDAKALAKCTFDFYNAKSDFNRSLSIAVYDMSKVDAMATAMKAVITAGNPGSVDKKLISQYGGFNPYLNRYYDFKQYAEALSAGSQEISALNKAYNDFVVYTDHTPFMWQGLSDEIDLAGTSGLSTYIMTSDNDTSAEKFKYKELAWWLDVVSAGFAD